jgi:hypothetical protein
MSRRIASWRALLAAAPRIRTHAMGRRLLRAALLRRVAAPFLALGAVGGIAIFAPVSLQTASASLPAHITVSAGAATSDTRPQERTHWNPALPHPTTFARADAPAAAQPDADDAQDGPDAADKPDAVRIASAPARSKNPFDGDAGQSVLRANTDDGAEQKKDTTTDDSGEGLANAMTGGDDTTFGSGDGTSVSTGDFAGGNGQSDSQSTAPGGASTAFLGAPFLSSTSGTPLATVVTAPSSSGATVTTTTPATSSSTPFVTTAIAGSAAASGTSTATPDTTASGTGSTATTGTTSDPAASGTTGTTSTGSTSSTTPTATTTPQNTDPAVLQAADILSGGTAGPSVPRTQQINNSTAVPEPASAALFAAALLAGLRLRRRRAA